MTRWIEGKMMLVSQEGMEVLGRGDRGPASWSGLLWAAGTSCVLLSLLAVEVKSTCFSVALMGFDPSLLLT